ncbi:MAG: RNA polymerase sigma factor [Thiolinea sp.]
MRAHSNDKTNEGKADVYKALLIQSAAKDQAAFKALYEQSSPLLFSILLRMLRDRELCEDVLQESFMKIWEHAASYSEQRGSAMTWMATITRNVARDKLRAMKVRHYQDESSDEVEELVSADSTPDKHVSLTGELGLVAAALEQMKAPQRECLVMSCYEGYSHSEIAGRLGLPLGTIKAWIKRGKTQIQELAGAVTPVAS